MSSNLFSGLILMLALASCTASHPSGKASLTASMVVTHETIDRVRADCTARHGGSGKDFCRCMAKTYESIGAYDLAGIWYQGSDAIKSKEMTIKQADKAMRNGQFIQAAYIYQTFQERGKAKAAWTSQAEEFEKKRHYLKAAAIYEGDWVNEPDRAQNAYFQLAEDLATKADHYRLNIRNRILKEAAQWYEKAGREDKAKEILRKISFRF